MQLSPSVRRLHLFVSDADVAPVTAALLTLAPLTFVDEDDPEQDPAWTRPSDTRWTELAEAYDDLERRAIALLDTLDVSTELAPDGNDLAPRTDIDDLRTTVRAAEQAVQDWTQQTTDLETDREQVQLLLEAVRAFRPLNVDLERLQHSKVLSLQIGTLPREHLATLDLALSAHPFVILPLYVYDTSTLIVAAGLQDDAAMLDEMLASAAVERLTLPDDLHGPAESALASLEERYETLMEQLDERADAPQLLVDEWGERLLRVWRQAQRNAMLTKQILRCSHHEDTYLIVVEGPADTVSVVNETVRRVTDDPFVLLAAPVAEAPAPRRDRSRADRDTVPLAN